MTALSAARSNIAPESWEKGSPKDLVVIENILNHFDPNIYFSMKNVINLKVKHPKYFEKNERYLFWTLLLGNG